jgi:hypothetical protein
MHGNSEILPPTMQALVLSDQKKFEFCHGPFQNLMLASRW